MSFDACAAIVEKGDPQRFMATMASTVDARRVLFPLYAFNVQVARAPWVTEEPMIAEMRLQWWRDALEEIAEGRAVRKHEVTTALADILDVEGAKALDRLIASRRWDVYKDTFEDAGHFQEYLEATAGELMWQAARSLGADDASREGVLAYGTATGLARYLVAVPELEDKGRKPLVDGRAEAIGELAHAALAKLDPRVKRTLPKSARAALVESWETVPLLRQIARQPERVAQGAVGLSPFRSKFRLLRSS
ncbi:squalene/phytoene synthase family protein [Octadecabacter sp. 1_MG-2023]|uniref:squalene/phytoene synthase family protein n=1 Tax=unclassified Octadecabacter TaxID=196158 RepID=UPI001C0923A9|nr:squalene/phytoene synthase family protein [Octadecabacter sp. 1_MG-2023]MBU2993406.1 squalene/phytoene synthase family protein [Octadecabacter sp. B2R22]MDO6733138.1 squalene/phytoene synthase family protein [Octadecabacter sp. 1_MG-2023]